MHKDLLKIKIHKKMRLLFLAIAFLALTQSLQAFPGGTYTINPSLAASSSNYRSFTAFANDLRNLTRGDGGAANYAIGGAGLQGNVTANVTPGTYNERLLLTAIVGSQATRRVTINGNGAILEFTPTSTLDAGVVDLNGTDFFTINNLEVRMNQTTYGYCFWFRNAADFNIVKNCKLRCDNITGIPNVGSAYIWMTNGTTGSSSGNFGNSNLVDSCDMRSGNGLNHGPYYAINMYGITTPAASNAGNDNVISNCLMRDFYLYGINHPYTYNTTIRNNTITNQGRTGNITTKYGLYTITGTFTIDRNRIYNLNGNTPQGSVIYPIFISMSSTTVPIMNSRITNNWIYDFGTSTLQCYLYWYSAYLNPAISLDVDFNTIAFDYPTTVNNTNNAVRNVQGLEISETIYYIITLEVAVLNGLFMTKQLHLLQLTDGPLIKTIVYSLVQMQVERLITVGEFKIQQEQQPEIFQICNLCMHLVSLVQTLQPIQILLVLIQLQLT
jgi:hypothetical protein